MQRVSGLAPLPALLRELGVEPDALLTKHGLSRGALDDPDGRIPFAAIGPLFASAAQSSRCDHLGVLLGLRFRMEQMGALGQLVRAARTLGEALATFTVHQHLYSRGVVAFLTTQADRVTFGMSVYHPGTLGMDLVHDSVAGMLLSGVRELTAPDWAPDEILLARRAPAALQPYRRAFPGRILFDAEHTGIRFSAKMLERRVPTADPDRFAAIDAQIAAWGRHSLVNDLRRALRVELIRGDASGNRVAQTLNLHRRTLNRRLKDVGTTFQRVLDEVRYDTARHFLELTDMPLVHVGAALGYADVSTFTRAFRRWSGRTPGRFRADRAGTLRSA
jgi:AraC-like DNA-binding protein